MGSYLFCFILRATSSAYCLLRSRKVTKSSLDWDSYKAAEGIEGDMDQVTKDGKSYLNKQDFLQRCDVRRFEQELEGRQAKRNSSAQ